MIPTGSPQREGKGGTLAFAAFHLDFTAVRFHDFLDDGQSQSRARGSALTRNPKKTLEEAGQIFLRNPRARVRVAQANVTPLCRLDVFADVRRTWGRMALPSGGRSRARAVA